MTGISEAPATSEELPPVPGGKWRLAALVAGILAVALAARYFGLGELLGDLRTGLRQWGYLGPLVFILIYVAASVAAIPGSTVTIAGGALFGWAWGIVLVSVGSTLGACLSFLIARYVARQAVQNWLAGNDTFRKLDRLTAEQGAVVVAFTRLVPLFPFNLLNYGFGLTAVPFWTYAFWSWLCLLPGIALYVTGADALSRGITEGRVPWELAAGMLGLASLLLILALAVRRRLRLPRPGDRTETSPAERTDTAD